MGSIHLAMDDGRWIYVLYIVLLALPSILAALFASGSDPTWLFQRPNFLFIGVWERANLVVSTGCYLLREERAKLVV